MEYKCSLLLFGEPNPTWRHQPIKYRHDGCGDAVHPAQKAVNDLAVALRLNPDSFDVSLELGHALLVAGRPNDAYGQINSSTRSWIETLVKSAPLIFTGLAATIAFRAKAWNIGAEGQLYVGAMAAYWAATTFSNLPRILLIPVILLAAFIIGAIYGFIPGFLKARMNVDEIIVTVMMNYIAKYGMSFILASVAQPASAQLRPNLGLQLSAGQLTLILTGSAGAVYSIQYGTDLAPTDDWRCLTFVRLPTTNYFWTDSSTPATGQRFYRAVVDVRTNLVFIPPGTFRMGSPGNEVDRLDDEGPQTVVTLTRGFYMGKYNVNKGEYLAGMVGLLDLLSGEQMPRIC